MKRSLVFLCSIILFNTAMVQGQIGVFESAVDIGNPKKAGTTQYDSDQQAYTIKGGGYNIWFGRDEFQFAHNKLSGDFILTANFSLVGSGVDPHRKVGWMIRESLEDDASHISATLHGDGLTLLQWRQLKGAHMRDPQDQIFAPKASYQILQLERTGN